MMKIKPIVIIIPVFLVILGFLGGSTLIWQLLIFSAAVIILGFLWALVGIRGLDISIKDLPDYSRVGDRFEEEITLKNRGSLPRFGVTADGLSDMPGYRNSVDTNLKSENSYSWQSKTRCLRRGLYSIGNTRISLSDPLGLITLTRISGTSRKILVFPETLNLPFFEPDTYAGTEYGTGRWLRSGTSSTIGQVREYTSGDTLNHVHWPSTAHMGTLMVKVFEPDQTQHRSSKIWLILDMHRDVQAGTGDKSTAEYGITITSSILNKYLDSGKETGLIVSGDRRYIHLPGVGNDFRDLVDGSLARIRADGNEPVNDLMSQELNRFDRDSVVIIVTPSTDNNLTGNVHLLRGRGCLVAVILLDPASFGGAAGIHSTARNLSSAGAQVYVVRKNDDITRVLDSRHVSSPLMYGD